MGIRTRSSRQRNVRSTESVSTMENAANEIDNSRVSLTKTVEQTELTNMVEEEKKEDYGSDAQLFHFQGVDYDSYEAMVKAKRERNHKMLVDSGLLQASQIMHSAPVGNRHRKRFNEEEIGIKTVKRKVLKEKAPLVLRKSNRLAGIPSEGGFVESESGGKFNVVHGASVDVVQETKKNEEERFFRNRINDGSDLQLDEAVRNIGSKWYEEDSVDKAHKVLIPKDESDHLSSNQHSCTMDEIQNFEVKKVAKVVPDRIYSVCFHPTRLLACAGDKTGYLGLWDIKDEDADIKQDVVLMKSHNGAISHLEWNDNNQLLSASYDGTIRLWDGASSFRQIFATYDDSPKYKDELGFNMETDGRFWMQYACFAHTYNNILFSTSHGTVGHIDLRQPKLSFYHNCSEKKINTVSLHPNGNVLATAGLDTMVKLWDLRKFGGHNSTSGKHNRSCLNSYLVGKSINSAFFSPSGRDLLTTTMANTCDILTNFDIDSDMKAPSKRIRHDNLTGRWLSTFMARWHPNKEDIFVVGSMNRPRMIDIFNSSTTSKVASVTGESMTAVASRCCFHPSPNVDILMGGNSSGRVVIAQK